jgi:hypothetical protein
MRAEPGTEPEADEHAAEPAEEPEASEEPEELTPLEKFHADLDVLFKPIGITIATVLKLKKPALTKWLEKASSDGKLKASLVKQMAEHYASNDSSAKLPGKTKSALLPWLIKYEPPAGETDDESEDEGGGEAGETEGEKGATGGAVEESDDAAEEDAAEEHGRGKRRRTG